MSSVADALAGAQYQPPLAQNRKSVLLAGAAGRLGERILVRLLGTAEYRHVHVLAEDAMVSTEPKLSPLTTEAWNMPVDHVIAVVSESPEAALPISRRRTEIYSSLAPSGILPLARRAKALGVSRFVLVTPTDVLSQPAAIHAQLANLMEAELHGIGFESLLLVRPSDHAVRLRYGNPGERLLGMLVNAAAGLMVGAKHAPLSLDNTARAVVRAMIDAEAGLSIIEIDRLHQLI